MSASPIILAVSPPTSIISNSHHHTQKRQVMIHSASSAAQRYSHRLSPSPPSSPLLTFTTSGSPPTLMVSRPVSPSSRYTSSTTATASPTLLSGSPNASSPLASIASLAVGSPPRNLHYSSSSLLSLSPPNKSYNHYAPHATTPLRVAFPHQNAVKPILKDNVRAWMEEDLVSQAISLSLEDVTMPMYPMSVVDSVRNKNVSISSPSSTSSSGRRIKNSLRFDRALERVCLFQSDATPSAIARGKRYTVTDPLAASESLPDNMGR
ncbi:hypothetical protein BC829DRAFT_445136 [Chytridium lagenaria]|nr:hypothetical protein BC829DRAFT_445136 [Chytridium lagenaria]